MAMAVAREHDPDEPVVEAIQSGDRYAFEELVRRHGRWVRSVVFGVLGNAEGVDDVTQQVWASFWQRIGELRDPSRWRAWLYRLARNAALDAGREITRRRGRVRRLAGDLPQRATSAVDGRSIERREQDRVVLDAIRALPAIYREPFVLRHVNGWSYRQIAGVMDMPVDSVETRLVRARRLLREALKDKLG